MTPAPDLLQPLPYHRRVADYLRAHEPAVWSWFASDRARTEFAERVRLDLLKSAYRLERDRHADAYRLAEDAASRLGVAASLTLYQSQLGTGMNAAKGNDGGSGDDAAAAGTAAPATTGKP